MKSKESGGMGLTREDGKHNAHLQSTANVKSRILLPGTSPTHHPPPTAHHPALSHNKLREHFPNIEQADRGHVVICIRIYIHPRISGFCVRRGWPTCAKESEKKGEPGEWGVGGGEWGFRRRSPGKFLYF